MQLRMSSVELSMSLRCDDICHCTTRHVIDVMRNDDNLQHITASHITCHCIA